MMAYIMAYIMTATIIKRYIAILALLVVMAGGGGGVSAWGAPAVKTLKGKATYYAEMSESPLEAQQKAREMAIYNGIQEAFGSVVSHTVMQEDMLNETGEMSRFYNSSAFELKGEWISDVKTEYVSELQKTGLAVTCEIEFRARQITNQAPAIECATLIAPDLRSLGSRYKDGDNLYASFCSPTTDGYLTVCITDETGTVSRLLPGRSSTSKAFKVTKGYDYVFFDQRRQSDDGSRMDKVNLHVAPGRKMEFNTLYFIFSPEPYAEGPWQRGATRRELPHMPLADFNGWLQKMAMHDPAMTWQALRLTIVPAPSKEEVIILK